MWNSKQTMRVNRRRRGAASVLSVQARKKDHQRVRAHRNAALLLAFLALTGLGVALVLGGRTAERHLFSENPRFTVTNLVLRSDGPLRTPRLIAEFAHVSTGMNLFALSPSAIRDRLMDDPIVESAEVIRRLPGTLEIAVRERMAVARIEAPRGGYAMAIDNQAVILGPSFTHPHLPLILGVDLGGRRPGDRVDDEVLRDALRLLRRAGSSDLAELMRISRMDCTDDEVFVLTLAGGQTIRLPREHAESRLFKLAAILRNPRGRAQQVLDLTANRNFWGH